MNYYAGPSLVQGTQEPEKPGPYPGIPYTPQANLPPGGSTYPAMSPQAMPSGYPAGAVPQPQPGYPNPGLYQASLNNFRPPATIAYVNQSSYPAVSSVYLTRNIGAMATQYAVSPIPGAPGNPVGAYPANMHAVAQNHGYPSSYLARGAMTSVTNSVPAYPNLQPPRGFIYPGAPAPQAAQQIPTNPYAGGVYQSQPQATQLYPGGPQYIPRP